MNRRGFLKSMLAAGVAPWVVTSAGVLMPVKALARPTLVVYGSTSLEFVRAFADMATWGTGAMKVEASADGVSWRRVDPKTIVTDAGAIVKPAACRHLQVDTIGMPQQGFEHGLRVVHTGPEEMVLPRPPQIIEANRNWNGPGGRGELSKAWLLTDD